MNRWTAVVVAVAVTAGLAGCGQSERLTRAQFVKRGNAICVSASERAARTSGGAGFEAMVKRQVVYQHTKADGMRALSPPQQLEARFAQYKRVLETQDHEFTRYLTALRAGRRPRSEFTKREEMQTLEEDLAAALRLGRCIDKIELR